MLPQEPRTVGWVWDQGRATAPHAADDPAAASRSHTQARTPASRGPPCFGAGAGQEANASLIAARLIIVGRCWLSHGHRGAGSPRGRAALGGSGVRERSWGLCPGVPPCPHGGQRVLPAHSCSAAGQGGLLLPVAFPIREQNADHLPSWTSTSFPNPLSPHTYPQASSPRASPASPCRGAPWGSRPL